MRRWATLASVDELSWRSGPARRPTSCSRSAKCACTRCRRCSAVATGGGCGGPHSAAVAADGLTSRISSAMTHEACKQVGRVGKLAGRARCRGTSARLCSCALTAKCAGTRSLSTDVTRSGRHTCTAAAPDCGPTQRQQHPGNSPAAGTTLPAKNRHWRTCAAGHATCFISAAREPWDPHRLHSSDCRP